MKMGYLLRAKPGPCFYFIFDKDRLVFSLLHYYEVMNLYLNVTVVVDEQNPGLGIQSFSELASNLSFQSYPLSCLYPLYLSASVKCLLLFSDSSTMEYFPHSMSSHQILLILIRPGQMLPHAFFSDILLNLVIFLLGLILNCSIVIYIDNKLLIIFA